ncbi:MAG: hypothetical protein WDM78_05845 [Puia sp.]
MSNLPVITSQAQILRMEVWVTNRNGTTTQARQVVALMDLGEPKPYNTNIHPQTAQPYPYNDANSEYRTIINNPGSRCFHPGYYRADECRPYTGAGL